MSVPLYARVKPSTVVVVEYKTVSTADQKSIFHT